MNSKISILSRKQFRDWSRKCSQEVLTLLGEGKVDQALELITSCSNSISEHNFQPDVIEASSFTLSFLGKRVEWHPKVGGFNKQTCLAAIRSFGKQAKSSLANWERLRRLITFRVLADREDYLKLTSEEANDLLREQDLIEVDIATWHNMAGWAFDKGDIGILERAYELLLTKPSHELGEAKWQRVNLMYKLMRGKIRASDIEKSIQVLEVKPQLDEFLEVFWPKLKELGIIDSHHEKLLQGKVGFIDGLGETTTDGEV